MLILLFVLLGIFTFVAYLMDWEMPFLSGIFLEVVISVLLLISSVLYINNLFTLEDQINLLNQKNTEVEEQISVVIDKYLEYEKNTYSSLKFDSKVLFVTTAYPELKGNELIQT